MFDGVQSGVTRGHAPGAQCESCKYECEAQCRRGVGERRRVLGRFAPLDIRCPEFCEGLIRDAALCLEQGSRQAVRLAAVPGGHVQAEAR